MPARSTDPPTELLVRRRDGTLSTTRAGESAWWLYGTLIIAVILTANWRSSIKVHYTLASRGVIIAVIALGAVIGALALHRQAAHLKGETLIFERTFGSTRVPLSEVSDAVLVDVIVSRRMIRNLLIRRAGSGCVHRVMSSLVYSQIPATVALLRQAGIPVRSHPPIRPEELERLAPGSYRWHDRRSTPLVLVAVVTTALVVTTTSLSTLL